MASLSSQNVTEFCEQVNPGPRMEKKRGPQTAEVRVQESWVASPEKRLMVWLAERTPPRIGPDHLTVLGFVAQVGAGACYARAGWNRY